MGARWRDIDQRGISLSRVQESLGFGRRDPGADPPERAWPEPKIVVLPQPVRAVEPEGEAA